MKNLEEFKKAVEEHKKLPFPADDSGNDELSDIHAELVEYDGYIAGLVSSVIGGVDVDQSKFKKREDLMQRLDKVIVANKDAKSVDAARKYLDYLSSLHELID